MMAPSICVLLLPLLPALLAHSATADLTIQCGQGSFSFGGPLVVGQSEDRLVKVADCSPDLSGALGELQQLVEAKPLAEICTQGGADEIRNYHDQFLDTARLPKEARGLFLGYGLVVSDLCRKQFVAKLAEDPPRILQQSDLVALDRLASEQALLSALSSDPNRQDYSRGLTMASVVTKLVGLKAKWSSSSSAAADKEKIYVQWGASRKIGQMRATCRRRLAPIYRPLVMPLVALAQAGFNYEAQPATQRSADVEGSVASWYRAVLVCESLRNVVLVGAPAGEQGASTEGSVLRVLTREEARRLKSVNPIENEEDDDYFEDDEDDEEDEGPKASFGLKRVVYKPEFGGGDGRAMDGFHYDAKQLKKAIDKWHAPSGKPAIGFMRKLAHLVKRTSSPQ